ncbi:MAG: hypothetical protein R3F22_02620 [Lysobacteraceae bacterium]
MGVTTLFTVFALYKPNASADKLLAAIDEEVARIVKDGVDDATLARVKTAMLADWYSGMESFISRRHLAKLQTLWGDANVVNQIAGKIEAVTSADVQRAAATYLTRANRTVIDRQPEAMIKAAEAAADSQAAAAKSE